MVNQDADFVADLYKIFDSLPRKSKPRPLGDGISEWTAMSGIGVYFGMLSELVGIEQDVRGLNISRRWKFHVVVVRVRIRFSHQM